MDYLVKYKYLPSTIYIVIILFTPYILGIGGGGVLYHLFSDCVITTYHEKELVVYGWVVFFMLLYPVFREVKQYQWFCFLLSVGFVYELEFNFFSWVLSMWVDSSLHISINLPLSLMWVLYAEWLIFDVVKRYILIINSVIVICAILTTYQSFMIYQSYN